MSADNWTYCPKCGETRAEQIERLTTDLNALYGKISPGEYVRRLEIISSAPAPSQTLREDYEIRMWRDGAFEVDYSCSCSTCDFTFTHQHKEKVSAKAQTKKETV